MFLFVHIEKCGGTTFSDILSLTFPRYLRITKNNFGGNDSRNDLTYVEFQKLLKYFPSGIGGHCIRPYKVEYSKPIIYITYFRDPIERYISHMNHNIEGGWSKSFSEFIKKDYYVNFMTKKMAGEDDFNKACLYLDKFDFIGDVDKFNQSLNAFQDVLNVRFYGNKIPKNERKNKEGYISFEDLNSQQKLLVEERNKNDILLYEKYILKSNNLKNYSDSIQLKEPSDLRVKIIGKLNKFKKENIVNPIRTR